MSREADHGSTTSSYSCWRRASLLVAKLGEEEPKLEAVGQMVRHFFHR